jgi:hypothetical protein
MGVDDWLWKAEQVLDQWGPGGPGIGWLGFGGTVMDAEAEQVAGQLRRLVAQQDASEEAREARSRALEAMGSQGMFFGGVVTLGDAARPVMVVSTPDAFVLLDADTNANPTGELARIPKKDVASVTLVDANGNEVADASIDPIRELDTPGDDRYAVVLRRADGSGTSVSFTFLSGEPAVFAKKRFVELRHEMPAV